MSLQNLNKAIQTINTPQVHKELNRGQRLLQKLFADPEQLPPLTTQQIEAAMKFNGITKHHESSPLKGWLHIKDDSRTMTFDNKEYSLDFSIGLYGINFNDETDNPYYYPGATYLVSQENGENKFSIYSEKLQKNLESRTGDQRFAQPIKLRDDYNPTHIHIALKLLRRWYPEDPQGRKKYTDLLFDTEYTFAQRYVEVSNKFYRSPEAIENIMEDVHNIFGYVEVNPSHYYSPEKLVTYAGFMGEITDQTIDSLYKVIFSNPRIGKRLDTYRSADTINALLTSYNGQALAERLRDVFIDSEDYRAYSQIQQGIEQNNTGHEILLGISQESQQKFLNDMYSSGPGSYEVGMHYTAKSMEGIQQVAPGVYVGAHGYHEGAGAYEPFPSHYSMQIIDITNNQFTTYELNNPETLPIFQGVSVSGTPETIAVMQNGVEEQATKKETKERLTDGELRQKLRCYSQLETEE